MHKVLLVRAVIQADHEGFRHSDHHWWQFDARSTSPITCELCQALHLQMFRGDRVPDIFPYHTHQKINAIRAKVHPHCFLEGTQIPTSEGLIPIENVKVGDLALTHKGRFKPVSQTHKNTYRGSIINIDGSGATSSHPFLTPFGYKRADALHSVNNQILDLSSMRLKSDDTPPSIFQDSIFPFIERSLPRGIMPISPINLNRQFQIRNRKINIESVKSILCNNFNTRFLKALAKQLFKRRQTTSSLDTLCAINQLLMRFRDTSDRFMRFRDLSFPLLLSHPSPFQRFSLRRTADMHSRKYQMSSNCRSAHMEPFSDSVLRLTGNVAENSFINRDYGSVFAPYHTTTLTNIRKEQYKGIVYNLSVKDDETYCVGKQRFIVHNCRCILRWAGRTEKSYNTPLGILLPEEEREIRLPEDEFLDQLGPSQLRQLLEMLWSPWE